MSGHGFNQQQVDPYGRYAYAFQYYQQLQQPVWPAQEQQHQPVPPNIHNNAHTEYLYPREYAHPYNQQQPPPRNPYEPQGLVTHHRAPDNEHPLPPTRDVHAGTDGRYTQEASQSSYNAIPVHNPEGAASASYYTQFPPHTHAPRRSEHLADGGLVDHNPSLPSQPQQQQPPPATLDSSLPPLTSTQLIHRNAPSGYESNNTDQQLMQQAQEQYTTNRGSYAHQKEAPNIYSHTYTYPPQEKRELISQSTLQSQPPTTGLPSEIAVAGIDVSRYNVPVNGHTKSARNPVEARVLAKDCPATRGIEKRIEEIHAEFASRSRNEGAAENTSTASSIPRNGKAATSKPIANKPTRSGKENTMTVDRPNSVKDKPRVKSKSIKGRLSGNSTPRPPEEALPRKPLVPARISTGLRNNRKIGKNNQSSVHQEDQRADAKDTTRGSQEQAHAKLNAELLSDVVELDGLKEGSKENLLSKEVLSSTGGLGDDKAHSNKVRTGDAIVSDITNLQQTGASDINIGDHPAAGVESAVTGNARETILVNGFGTIGIINESMATSTTQLGDNRVSEEEIKNAPDQIREHINSTALTRRGPPPLQPLRPQTTSSTPVVDNISTQKLLTEETNSQATCKEPTVETQTQSPPTTQTAETNSTIHKPTEADSSSDEELPVGPTTQTAETNSTMHKPTEADSSSDEELPVGKHTNLRRRVESSSSESPESGTATTRIDSDRDTRVNIKRCTRVVPNTAGTSTESQRAPERKQRKARTKVATYRPPRRQPNKNPRTPKSTNASVGEKKARSDRTRKAEHNSTENPRKNSTMSNKSMSSGRNTPTAGPKPLRQLPRPNFRDLKREKGDKGKMRENERIGQPHHGKQHRSMLGTNVIDITHSDSEDSVSRPPLLQRLPTNDNTTSTASARTSVSDARRISDSDILGYGQRTLSHKEGSYSPPAPLLRTSYQSPPPTLKKAAGADDTEIPKGCEQPHRGISQRFLTDYISVQRGLTTLQERIYVMFHVLLGMVKSNSEEECEAIIRNRYFTIPSLPYSLEALSKFEIPRGRTPEGEGVVMIDDFSTCALALALADEKWEGLSGLGQKDWLLSQLRELVISRQVAGALAGLRVNLEGSDVWAYEPTPSDLARAAHRAKTMATDVANKGNNKRISHTGSTNAMSDADEDLNSDADASNDSETHSSTDVSPGSMSGSNRTVRDRQTRESTSSVPPMQRILGKKLNQSENRKSTTRQGKGPRSVRGRGRRRNTGAPTYAAVVAGGEPASSNQPSRRSARTRARTSERTDTSHNTPVLFTATKSDSLSASVSEGVGVAGASQDATKITPRVKKLEPLVFEVTHSQQRENRRLRRMLSEENPLHLPLSVPVEYSMVVQGRKVIVQGDGEMESDLLRSKAKKTMPPPLALEERSQKEVSRARRRINQEKEQKKAEAREAKNRALEEKLERQREQRRQKRLAAERKRVQLQRSEEEKDRKALKEAEEARRRTGDLTEESGKQRKRVYEHGRVPSYDAQLHKSQPKRARMDSNGPGELNRSESSESSDDSSDEDMPLHTGSNQEEGKVAYPMDIRMGESSGTSSSESDSDTNSDASDDDEGESIRDRGKNNAGIISSNFGMGDEHDEAVVVDTGRGKEIMETNRFVKLVGDEKVISDHRLENLAKHLKIRFGPNLRLLQNKHYMSDCARLRRETGQLRRLCDLAKGVIDPKSTESTASPAKHVHTTEAPSLSATGSADSGVVVDTQDEDDYDECPWDIESTEWDGYLSDDELLEDTWSLRRKLRVAEAKLDQHREMRDDGETIAGERDMGKEENLLRQVHALSEVLDDYQSVLQSQYALYAQVHRRELPPVSSGDSTVHDPAEGTTQLPTTASILAGSEKAADMQIEPSSAGAESARTSESSLSASPGSLELASVSGTLDKPVIANGSERSVSAIDNLGMIPPVIVNTQPQISTEVQTAATAIPTLKDIVEARQRVDEMKGRLKTHQNFVCGVYREFTESCMKKFNTDKKVKAAVRWQIVSVKDVYKRSWQNKTNALMLAEKALCVLRTVESFTPTSMTARGLVLESKHALIYHLVAFYCDVYKRLKQVYEYIEAGDLALFLNILKVRSNGTSGVKRRKADKQDFSDYCVALLNALFPVYTALLTDEYPETKRHLRDMLEAIGSNTASIQCVLDDTNSTARLTLFRNLICHFIVMRCKCTGGIDRGMCEDLSARMEVKVNVRAKEQSILSTPTKDSSNSTALTPGGGVRKTPASTGRSRLLCDDFDLMMDMDINDLTEHERKAHPLAITTPVKLTHKSNLHGGLHGTPDGSTVSESPNRSSTVMFTGPDGVSMPLPRVKRKTYDFCLLTDADLKDVAANLKMEQSGVQIKASVADSIADTKHVRLKSHEYLTRAFFTAQWFKAQPGGEAFPRYPLVTEELCLDPYLLFRAVLDHHMREGVHYSTPLMRWDFGTLALRHGLEAVNANAEHLIFMFYMRYLRPIFDSLFG